MVAPYAKFVPGATGSTDQVRKIGVLMVSQIAEDNPLVYEAIREIEREANQALSDLNERVLVIANRPDPTFPKIDVFEKFAVGIAALTAGACTVYETKVRSDSLILVVYRIPSGTPGFLACVPSSQIPGVSFNIQSYDAAAAPNAGDTSEVVWFLVNP